MELKDSGPTGEARVLVDCQGQIIGTNAEACLMVGRSASELTGADKDVLSGMDLRGHSVWLEGETVGWVFCEASEGSERREEVYFLGDKVGEANLSSDLGGDVEQEELFYRRQVLPHLKRGDWHGVIRTCSSALDMGKATGTASLYKAYAYYRMRRMKKQDLVLIRRLVSKARERFSSLGMSGDYFGEELLKTIEPKRISKY